MVSRSPVSPEQASIVELFGVPWARLDAGARRVAALFDGRPQRIAAGLDALANRLERRLALFGRIVAILTGLTRRCHFIRTLGSALMRLFARHQTTLAEVSRAANHARLDRAQAGVDARPHFVSATPYTNPVHELTRFLTEFQTNPSGDALR